MSATITPTSTTLTAAALVPFYITGDEWLAGKEQSLQSLASSPSKSPVRFRSLLLTATALVAPCAAFAQTVVVPAPSATLVDLSAIMQPVLAVIGATVAGLLAIYIPKALAAFEARTGIQLTDQQRAKVLGAVQTAAGMIETRLDQGVLQVAHVNVENPQVRAEAQAAINAVPVAAAALNMTVDGVSRMIVGSVNTAAHGTAPVPLAAPVPSPVP